MGLFQIFLRVEKLQPLGTYDLQEILHRVRDRYFAPDYAPKIRWARRRKEGLRSITFGSYNRRKHEIRINPILDDPQVPLYFLEFVVYHEMLHGICLPQMSYFGKNVIHTKEFKEEERKFEKFEAAKAWAKQRVMNLSYIKIFEEI